MLTPMPNRTALAASRKNRDTWHHFTVLNPHLRYKKATNNTSWGMSKELLLMSPNGMLLQGDFDVAFPDPFIGQNLGMREVGPSE